MTSPRPIRSQEKSHLSAIYYLGNSNDKKGRDALRFLVSLANERDDVDEIGKGKHSSNSYGPDYALYSEPKGPSLTLPFSKAEILISRLVTRNLVLEQGEVRT